MKIVVALFIAFQSLAFGDLLVPDMTEIETGVFFIRCERSAGECLKTSNYQEWLCGARFSPKRRVSVGQVPDPICEFKNGHVPCYCLDNDRVLD